MVTQKKIAAFTVLVIALTMCGCGLYGGKKVEDPDRKFLACRASISVQNEKKGMMVTIENSGDKAFNVDWIIEEAVNLAIKKGSIIVNKKSTETYFHEALEQAKPVSGEVKMLKFIATSDKAVDEF